MISVSPFWHVLRSGDIKSILQTGKITTTTAWKQEAKENKLCDCQCCCLESVLLLALALTTLLALSPLSYIQAAIESLPLFTSTQSYHTYLLCLRSPACPCLCGGLPLTVLLMSLTFLVGFPVSHSYRSFCSHSFRLNLISLLCISSYRFPPHLASLPGKSHHFSFLLIADVRILRAPAGCAAPSPSEQLAPSVQPNSEMVELHSLGSDL